MLSDDAFLTPPLNMFTKSPAAKVSDAKSDGKPEPDVSTIDPVITAVPANGKPAPPPPPLPAFKANDAVVANDAVPIILPETNKLPDIITFLDELIINILVLPVDTENRVESVEARSVIENIPPLLPDTLNIVEPLPISCNTLAFDDADIIVLPVTDSELKLAVSV